VVDSRHKRSGFALRYKTGVVAGSGGVGLQRQLASWISLKVRPFFDREPFAQAVVFILNAVATTIPIIDDDDDDTCRLHLLGQCVDK